MRFFTVLLVVILSNLAGTGISPAQEKSSQVIPEIERRIPPAGTVTYPEKKRQAIERRLKDYKDRLWEIGDDSHVADVGALVKAVDFALRNGEFYNKKELPLVEKMLSLADARFEEINEKQSHSWLKQHGLIVRGYESSIDESFQPYGLEIPKDLDLSKPVPLLVWLHGRGDKTTDIHFLNRCMNRSQALGGKVPEQQDCIILHPFGRQCIGWKHSGEIDIFEAIEAVKKDYNIDSEKIALAGFSMGGAGAWHVGAHYRDQFCAVHAGAGFAETAIYNKLKPENFPPPYEQTLWQVYDVPNYVRNFLNGPVLAYAGENDKQKQSSDLMVDLISAEGGKIPYVIGPGMGHRYHDDSVKEIWTWVKKSWATGNSPHQKKIEIQTRTLRYAKHHWLKITGLQKHWEETRASAEWNPDEKTIALSTKNIASLEISDPNAQRINQIALNIDGQHLKIKIVDFPVNSVSLMKNAAGKWKWGEPQGLLKRPGLQGPIDDAFLSRFILVPPDKKPANLKAAHWVDFELAHFRKRWRELFRGIPIEETSSGLDSADMDDANLILWGDPESNSMIAEIADQLPVTNWTKDSFTFRGKKYDASHHMPVFIFPNPVNPKRYIVINSGHTFRESHDRTNSLQNPKLGDWAIIDLDQLPDGAAPGRIVEAGFFDEAWK